MRISDWSSDVCSSDLLAAGDLRVSVISGGRNRGPAGARNLGLAVAAGEWIALLDADDAFEPERLARLVPLARQCGADMLADNLLLESDDGGTEPMLAPSEAASCAPMSAADFLLRSEEPTSELPSLMRLSYAVFCLKNKK